MNISYQREMKRNYLIVEAEVQDEIPFEQKMLEQNQIDGLLHFQVRKKDMETRFFYEITSKQPLFRLLEGQAVRARQIRALVFGIAQALDHMEPYLLNENSVLLTPEYLYVEPESLKVWLCLIPGLERDLTEDYSRLLEYLLGKVDHKDKESVVLAYGLYQETRKENYGMGDILRLAEQKIDAGSFGLETAAEEPPEAYVSRQDPWPGGAGTVEEDWKPGTVRAKQIRTDTVQETSGFFGKWKQRMKDRREEKQREQEREMQMPWDLMYAGDARQDYGTPSYCREERGGMPGNTAFSAAPEPETPLPQKSSGTVLLNAGMGAAESGTRKLTALDAGEADIRIAYYPFIIGKQENLVDHVLNRETVSRLHLRIDRKEERYYVQDLNSTNGTLINGRMLENNETVEIREGTEINIAGGRYRFE